MIEVTFLPNKALIYATNKRGLLIFQKREFPEETGILTPTDMTFLELDEHPFERNGQPHQGNRPVTLFCRSSL